jgi:hypothetical protein
MHAIGWKARQVQQSVRHLRIARNIQKFGRRMWRQYKYWMARHASAIYRRKRTCIQMIFAMLIRIVQAEIHSRDAKVNVSGEGNHEQGAALVASGG